MTLYYTMNFNGKVTIQKKRKIRFKYRRHYSLRGRRLKGTGKGVLGARETRGAREEEGREGNACQETIVFAIPPTNYRGDEWPFKNVESRQI